MIGAIVAEIELLEDVGDVLLDGVLADVQALGDPVVGEAFDDQREHVAFARRERGERVADALAAEHARDDLRIERGAAGRDAADRGQELVEVGDAVLEQVADALRVVAEQLQRSLQLRVATFNIRNSSADDGNDSWVLRREATAQAIEALAADVVGLQEVLPDQLEYLRERFAQYEIVGVGRDDGVHSGEHSVVMVRRRDWRVESEETRWLSDEPTMPGSVGWDADLTRIATLARLVHTDGTRVGIANTHYDHVGEIARVESSNSSTSGCPRRPIGTGCCWAI